MVQVINKAGVRETARSSSSNGGNPVNVGNDFYDALDQRAMELIRRAVERAQANGRKTIKSRDV